MSLINRRAGDTSLYDRIVDEEYNRTDSYEELHCRFLYLQSE